MVWKWEAESHWDVQQALIWQQLGKTVRSQVHEGGSKSRGAWRPRDCLGFSIS